MGTWRETHNGTIMKMAIFREDDYLPERKSFFFPRADGSKEHAVSFISFNQAYVISYIVFPPCVPSSHANTRD